MGIFGRGKESDPNEERILHQIEQHKIAKGLGKAAHRAWKSTSYEDAGLKVKYGDKTEEKPWEKPTFVLFPKRKLTLTGNINDYEVLKKRSKDFHGVTIKYKGEQRVKIGEAEWDEQVFEVKSPTSGHIVYQAAEDLLGFGPRHGNHRHPPIGDTGFGDVTKPFQPSYKETSDAIDLLVAQEIRDKGWFF